MLPNFSHLFPQLPDHSRVWLFLGERQLDDTEAHFTQEKIALFVSGWTAHNKALHADGTLLFNQYIVFAVDEEVEKASGCSIDSAVRIVKSLSQELNIDFFNRLKVLSFANDEPHLISYHDATNQQLPFLNPLISSLGELRNSWMLNVK